jgi:hypothetical protein
MLMTINGENIIANIMAIDGTMELAVPPVTMRTQ